jgi:hypothetical protein
MPITIKNEKVERLAREAAREANTSMTQAILEALELQMAQRRGKRREPILKETLLDISERCSSLPDLDKRSVDEILDYDSSGVPSHGR